jgi:polar amino acid transport system substrate-binding protein
MLFLPNATFHAWRHVVIAIYIFIVFGAGVLSSSSASARTLDEITDAHSFSICASPDDLPFSSSSATMQGIYIEIARKVADALGVELTVDWVRSREQIRFTKCDAVIGSAALEDADTLAGIEKKTIKPKILTMPYMTAVAVLVLPSRHQEVRSIADLTPLHVAVPSGSVIHKMLNDHGVPVWVRFRNDAEIIDAILSGQADAGVVSQAGFGWYLKNHPEAALIAREEVLADPALQYKVAIGLRRTNIETVTRVNAILKTLMNEGVIPEILNRYGIKSVLP